MIKIYSFSVNRNEHYHPDQHLELSVHDLSNLRNVIPSLMGLEGKLNIPPIHTDVIDGELRPIGYRVVRRDGLSSLGLRNNPHILQYPIGEWYFLAEDWVEAGPQDWGGISIARTLGKAKWLKKYMEEEKGIPTRTFKTAFADIVHHKEWRTKTNGILMYEEIKW